jgi:hypothetical protein
MKTDSPPKKQQVIDNEDEIPTEGSELEKYVDNPSTNNNRKFTFQTTLQSKININEICNQPVVKQRFIDSQIKIFESKLVTNKAGFAGFFDKPNPNKNGIYFLELKINQHLGNCTMDYQVGIRPLYIEGKGESCMVYMLLSGIENITII